MDFITMLLDYCFLHISEVGYSRVFGRGLTNYAASEVRRVIGPHSDQFEAVLGYRGSEEIIHRDNLVLDFLPSL